MDAFEQGLRQFWYVEGQNVAFEDRWAHGRSERLPDLPAELVLLKVDTIAVANTLGVLAATRSFFFTENGLPTSRRRTGSRRCTD
ncbi:MAG TPA: hypothetical protein VGD07_17545 [Methylomirabilota bacterium]